MKLMVRQIFKGLAIAVCLGCSFVLYGEKKAANEPVYVELKFKDTPLVKYVNDVNIEKADNKWLVVEAYYSPAEKKITKDKYAWLDDVTVEFEVLIPSSYNGKNVFARFTGQVTYWAIPLDGRRHVFEGFIPPQIVDRYLRSGIKSNRKVLETSIGAKVTFYDKNHRQVGRYFSQLKGESDQQLEKAFERASDSVEGGVITIKDGIYSRNETPWQFINYSSYDLIKRNDKQ